MTQYQAQLSPNGISATGASQYVDLSFPPSIPHGCQRRIQFVGLMYLFLILWFGSPKHPYGAIGGAFKR